jgi:hypothetical protein
VTVSRPSIRTPALPWPFGEYRDLDELRRRLAELPSKPTKA